MRAPPQPSEEARSIIAQAGDAEDLLTIREAA